MGTQAQKMEKMWIFVGVDEGLLVVNQPMSWMNIWTVFEAGLLGGVSRR